MRKCFLILFLYFSSFCSAQNWFPLHVGNEWFYNTGQHYIVTGDTTINNIQYFFIPALTSYPVRYDTTAQKIFLFKDSSEFVNTDFLADTNYTDLDWDGKFRDVKPDNTGSSVKGFSWLEVWLYDIWWNYNTHYFNNIGLFEKYTIWHGRANTSGTDYGLIFFQAKIYDNDSTIRKVGSIHQPLIYYNGRAKIINFAIDILPQINYGYEKLYPLNFYAISYYSNGIDTVLNDTVKGIYLNNINYEVKLNLDSTLLKNDYTIYYKLVAETNDLFQTKDISPDTGYYSAKYVSGVDDDISAINSFSLDQNYPNPFNPSTAIKYSIGKRCFVNLKIYDVLGKEVTTLVNSEQPQGIYNIIFNASNLPSGLYFYRINAGDFSSTKKMLLVK